MILRLAAIVLTYLYGRWASRSSASSPNGANEITITADHYIRLVSIEYLNAAKMADQRGDKHESRRLMQLFLEAVETARQQLGGYTGPMG